MLNRFTLLNSSRLTQIGLVVILSTLYSQACLQTIPGKNPGSGDDQVCCPPLFQTNTSNIYFINGLETFEYNNNSCPTVVIVTCRSVLNLGLYAGIVVNNDHYLSTGLGSTSFTGKCNSKGQWEMGEPPLVVSIIQCRLTRTNVSP